MGLDTSTPGSIFHRTPNFSTSNCRLPHGGLQARPIRGRVPRGDVCRQRAGDRADSESGTRARRSAARLPVQR